MKLTKADKAAIQNGDSNYLVSKGVRYFHDQDYEVALDYYHLAASMGSGKAAGEIGYCYMYGLGVPAETDLGLSYLRIGMDSGDIDSYYKIGKIYSEGDVLEKDRELGAYYYSTALAELLEDYVVMDQLNYPYLFHALSKETFAGGELGENLALSYKYLLIAEAGYTLAVKNGAYYYEDILEELKGAKDSDFYDDVRKEVEEEFEAEYLAG